MLIAQKANSEQIVHVSIPGRALDDLLSKEWLLTNRRGGYAASTIVGCNTSGYHGLLIGSLTPPVNRIMALSTCLETVVCGTQLFQLSTFDFGDKLLPAGHAWLREFWRDTGVHFLYDLHPIEVLKSVHLARDRDAVVVEYMFRSVREPVEFLLRPFVGLRDFHMLQSSQARFACDELDSSLRVRQETPAVGELLLTCPGMQFERDEQWWYNFSYRVNRTRGLASTEDLWAPGFFRGQIGSASHIVFSARFGERLRLGRESSADASIVRSDLVEHQDGLTRIAKAQTRADRALSLAADQFIVTRGDADGERVSIVAGYPWFADWGRDTFIALPGLLLATGRHEEARSVLTTFAAAADQGMIPNRFDDRSETAHFNSVDASLWFIRAAFEYLDATGDLRTFSQELLPVIRWIIDSYQNGTRFDIHADDDGLIAAGDSNTQLTWMDAKYGDVVFTPRWGKAVEVNALWHNALRRMSRFCEQEHLPDASRYTQMAAQVADSFATAFWNEEQGYLNDTVMPDGSVDASLRPNQIFAVSLPYGPPLTRQQQRAVVAVVEQELLTPYGLRTLNRQDARYKGRCEGSAYQRDEAYHQGTVWAWLIGPFIEAYLKVRDSSAESRRQAGRMLDPLMRHLTQDACLGSVSEIFDGDPPHTPRGCPAQAWSVGELIRARKLVRGARSNTRMD
ncbi:MAG: glycogen debranching enzyme family protein [Sedimentisphaerales bacterium]|nr:glycogen debranching enzyme family protein [Sedimentisphaerales bacterium]